MIFTPADLRLLALSDAAMDAPGMPGRPRKPPRPARPMGRPRLPCSDPAVERYRAKLREYDRKRRAGILTPKPAPERPARTRPRISAKRRRLGFSRRRRLCADIDRNNH